MSNQESGYENGEQQPAGDESVSGVPDISREALEELAGLSGQKFAERFVEVVDENGKVRVDGEEVPASIALEQIAAERGSELQQSSEEDESMLAERKTLIGLLNHCGDVSDVLRVIEDESHRAVLEKHFEISPEDLSSALFELTGDDQYTDARAAFQQKHPALYGALQNAGIIPGSNTPSNEATQAPQGETSAAERPRILQALAFCESQAAVENLLSDPGRAKEFQEAFGLSLDEFQDASFFLFGTNSDSYQAEREVFEKKYPELYGALLLAMPQIVDSTPQQEQGSSAQPDTVEDEPGLEEVREPSVAELFSADFAPAKEGPRTRSFEQVMQSERQLIDNLSGSATMLELALKVKEHLEGGGTFTVKPKGQTDGWFDVMKVPLGRTLRDSNPLARNHYNRMVDYSTLLSGESNHFDIAPEIVAITQAVLHKTDSSGTRS